MEEVAVDKIIRSRRRTLGLEVARDASLVIRAPIKMPLNLIEQAVSQKGAWIAKKQAIARQRLKESSPKKFVAGEDFLYLGKAYPLSFSHSFEPPLTFRQGFFLIKGYEERAKHLFLAWYKKEAQSLIKERLGRYSSAGGFKCSAFKITNAQRCWGSCTHRGVLRFSWRLIMAPLEVIDYVVVHELAHLEVKSHSPRFWKRVERVLPRYKEYQRWLKDRGHILAV